MNYVRLLNESDREAFITRFLTLQQLPGQAGWVREVDAGGLFDYLVTRAVVFQETYLLLMTKDRPWYANYDILVENLFIRLYKDGAATFTDVVEFLKWAAQQHNCRYLAVGTALAVSNNHLASKWQQHGFRVEGIELSLEV